MLHTRLFSIDKKDLIKLRRWGKQLMGTRRKEAVDTLIYERCVLEAVFEAPGTSKNRVNVLTMQMFSGKPRAADMKQLINQEHAKIKKLLRKEELKKTMFEREWKPIYILSTPPPPSSGRGSQP